jgi:hypothetical protein|tara:strand:+ start:150 stop:1085 length:936 start_codon:yes stop_codon:yes gene_type:complete
MASILNNIDTLQENVAGGDLSFGDYLRNLKILQEAQKDLDSGKYPGSGMDMFGVVRDSFQKKVDDIKGNLEAQSEKYMGGGGGDRFDMPPADKVKELPPEQQDVMDSIKVTKLLDKDKKSKTKKDLGFFGNMIETLKTDADARQKFFDQLGGIGAEISRPTDPGEARSLVRDVIVGSERGEGKSIAKRKAAAEEMANVALARQRTNPMQYYTTAMKELTQQAVAAGLTPGTAPFIEFIGEKLRGQGLSKNLASYSETLRNLNDQLLTAQAIPDNQEAVQTILKQIKDIQGLITTELGGTSSGSNDIPYNPK